VLWAAGVQASPLGRDLGPCDRAGRVQVLPDLSVPGHDRVFVIGDLAAVRYGSDWVPGVAPAAVQMGRHAARNIRSEVQGKPRRPFAYVNRGMLATVGRSRAVAQLGRLRFSGGFAWLLWLVIHIWTLIDFRSRIAVLLDWAWAYFTLQRSARIILDEREQRDE